MNIHPERERLTALREGWLEEDEARQLRAHISGCTACRSVMAELETVVEIIRDQAGNVVPPPGGYDALLEATLAMCDRVTPLPAPPRRFRFGPAIAAAAVLIITLTAIFLLDHGAPAPSSVTASAEEVDLPDFLLEEHALASDTVPFSTGVTLVVSARSGRR